MVVGLKTEIGALDANDVQHPTPIQGKSKRNLDSNLFEHQNENDTIRRR